MARYVLLQTSLDPLPIKRLARAFVASGARVSLDAPAVARHAFGVLLDDLSATAASSLAQALDAEGIAVDACEQSALAPLPRARVLHRAELSAEGLVRAMQLYLDANDKTNAQKMFDRLGPYKTLAPNEYSDGSHKAIIGGLTLPPP